MVLKKISCKCFFLEKIIKNKIKKIRMVLGWYYQRHEGIIIVLIISSTSYSHDHIPGDDDDEEEDSASVDAVAVRGGS
jgi:hypothetical protein